MSRVLTGIAPKWYVNFGMFEFPDDTVALTHKRWKGMERPLWLAGAYVNQHRGWTYVRISPNLPHSYIFSFQVEVTSDLLP